MTFSSFSQYFMNYFDIPYDKYNIIDINIEEALNFESIQSVDEAENKVYSIDFSLQGFILLYFDISFDFEYEKESEIVDYYENLNCFLKYFNQCNIVSNSFELGDNIVAKIDLDNIEHTPEQIKYLNIIYDVHKNKNKRFHISQITTIKEPELNFYEIHKTFFNTLNELENKNNFNLNKDDKNKLLESIKAFKNNFHKKGFYYDPELNLNALISNIKFDNQRFDLETIEKMDSFILKCKNAECEYD